jgi:hypothetical protein
LIIFEFDGKEDYEIFISSALSDKSLQDTKDDTFNQEYHLIKY